jgi:hypothetical protein
MKLPVSEYCSLPYRASLNNNSISLCFRSVSLNTQRSELQEVYGIFQAVNPKLVLKKYCKKEAGTLDGFSRSGYINTVMKLAFNEKHSPPRSHPNLEKDIHHGELK